MPILKRRQSFNRLRCGDDVVDMDRAYREGALAHRSGLTDKQNRYPRVLSEARSWLRGYLNEAAGEHIRFGIDVIAASRRHTSTFEIDPDVPRNGSGAVDLQWYREQLERRDAVNERVERLRVEYPFATPERYREIFEDAGFSLSNDQLADLHARLRQQEAIRAGSLNRQQGEALLKMSPLQHTLILAIAELAEDDPRRMVQTKHVDWACGRRPGWAASQARKLGDAAFLVQFSRNGYCDLTPEGWASVRILRELEIIEHLDAVLDGDTPPASPKM